MGVTMGSLGCPRRRSSVEVPMGSHGQGSIRAASGTTLSVLGTSKMKENEHFYGFTDYRGMPAGRGRERRAPANQVCAGIPANVFIHTTAHISTYSHHFSHHAASAQWYPQVARTHAPDVLSGLGTARDHPCPGRARPTGRRLKAPRGAVVFVLIAGAFRSVASSR